MPTLVSDVIADCQLVLSDFPLLSDTTSLRLIQEADNFVLQHARLITTDTEDLTLVAGQGQYALDDDIVKIWAATYYNSAGSYIPLKPTSFDELDYTNPTWRDLDSSSPFQYYDQGSVIGLFPKPATATSAGYPKVTLYVSRKRALTTSTQLPAQIPSYDPWVYHACRSWCRYRHSEMLPEMQARLTDSMREMLDYMQTRQARNKPRFSFLVPSINNR